MPKTDKEEKIRGYTQRKSMWRGVVDANCYCKGGGVILEDTGKADKI